MTDFEKLMRFLGFRSVKEMYMTLGISRSSVDSARSTGKIGFVIYAKASEYADVSVRDLKAL